MHKKNSFTQETKRKDFGKNINYDKLHKWKLFSPRKVLQKVGQYYALKRFRLKLFK